MEAQNSKTPIVDRICAALLALLLVVIYVCGYICYYVGYQEWIYVPPPAQTTTPTNTCGVVSSPVDETLGLHRPSFSPTYGPEHKADSMSVCTGTQRDNLLGSPASNQAAVHPTLESKHGRRGHSEFLGIRLMDLASSAAQFILVLYQFILVLF